MWGSMCPQGLHLLRHLDTGRWDNVDALHVASTSRPIRRAQRVCQRAKGKRGFILVQCVFLSTPALRPSREPDAAANADTEYMA